jgi:hypothetical protein
MSARTLLGTNTAHSRGPEILQERDGRHVCKTWCRSCALLIVTAGSTELEAQEKVWSLIRQHQGHVFAADPGWQAVAA